MKREIGKALTELELALIEAGVPEDKARDFVDALEEEIEELVERMGGGGQDEDGPDDEA